MITIEESFGIIQKLLLVGFETKTGIFTRVGSAADPDWAAGIPPACFYGYVSWSCFEGGK
jgi:hypothetical protein